jgi:hypothetical protein
LIQMSGADDDLLRLLAAIAAAAADDNIRTGEDAVTALSAGLVSVLADSVEDAAVGQVFDGASATTLSKAVAAVRKNPPSFEQRARLNSVLLTVAGAGLRPGNVYPAAACGAPGDAKDRRRFVHDVYYSQRARNDDAWWRDFAARLEKRGIPVFVEITPACDHATGKWEGARFVAGLLISVDEAEVLEADVRIPAESRGFAKDFESIWIDYTEPKLAGCYKLVMNARRVLTCSLDGMREHTALFRFRHPVVADIQAWFASHAARPGYVSVR